MYGLDLISVLRQEGHSGIIEGNCRVHYLGDFLSTKDYFKDENSDNVVDITFSFGTEPLGRFKFEGVQITTDIVSGHLDLKHLDTKDEVTVKIDTEISGMANFSKFKAVMYKNGRGAKEEELNLLRTPITHLDLSVRAYNALKAAEIRTLGELVSFQLSSLLSFRNVGKKTLTELEDLLKANGYLSKK